MNGTHPLRLIQTQKLPFSLWVKRSRLQCISNVNTSSSVWRRDKAPRGAGLSGGSHTRLSPRKPVTSLFLNLSQVVFVSSGIWRPAMRTCCCSHDDIWFFGCPNLHFFFKPPATTKLNWTRQPAKNISHFIIRISQKKDKTVLHTVWYQYRVHKQAMCA